MYSFKARIFFLFALIGICFIVIVGRLVKIQIINMKEYADRSKSLTKQRTIIPAQRGAIYDGKGRVLARSVDPATLLRVQNKGAASQTGGTGNENRFYPYGESAGQVLGYIGRDGNGLAGVEYLMDGYLKGENGWTIVNKYGALYRYCRIGMPHKDSQRGYDIYLTIDIAIQQIVEQVLSAQVKASNAKAGMCVIMDPVSGAVLAMANVPLFNPNTWKMYTAEDKMNRCIAFNYEPGSTFKIITAAAALQENIKNESDVIDGGNGTYEIYDQVIRDEKPYGRLTFTEALCRSSNVCFAKISQEIGSRRFFGYTKNFGFGMQSGITLPGEEAGIVHSIPQWSGRTLATMAIGQEISATLLQMMVAYCAVANGGLVVQPRIVDKVVAENRTVITEWSPAVKRRVISQTTAARLRSMMKGVVDNGTAKQCRLLGVSIGGKTGTSQKIEKKTGTYSQKKGWASFIGFAPAVEPVLVCGIVIDEPARAEHGGEVASPAFREILHKMVNHPQLAFAEKLLADSLVRSSGHEELSMNQVR